jgi:hypothetical protein
MYGDPSDNYVRINTRCDILEAVILIVGSNSEDGSYTFLRNFGNQKNFAS